MKILRSESEFCEKCGHQKPIEFTYIRFCEDCYYEWLEENEIYE